MSSAVAELDNVLQSMLHLKPPGVSGSKISTLTSLCTANIQSESVLVGKIYTHFKKAPNTHKLGVLYVVDSVTRQWVDQARKSGQQVGPSATDGTFAAGVNRVTELLPSLMNDIIGSAPNDQKPKIKKLVEIWERSSTFPAAMLSSFKSQLDAAPTNNAESTTPIHSPAPGFVPLGQPPAANAAPTAAPAQQQNPSSILEALKAMAAKQTSSANAAQPAAAAAPAPAPALAANNLNALLGMQAAPQPTTPVNQGQGQNVNPLAALLAGVNNGAQAPTSQSAPPNPLAALFPQPQQPPLTTTAPGPAPAPVAPDAQATLQLVQLMAQKGIPPDQWAAALQVLNSQQAGKGAVPFPPPPLAGNNMYGQSRDRDGHVRSPDSGRRRSRSPDYGRGDRNGRPGSPGFDGYRNGSDRRGNDYRQRSPMGRRRRSPSPQPTQGLPPPGEKFMEWDHNLPKDNIKVLSRTLFVGGVTSNEAHLRSLFSKYGVVQTCIVNVDKRHAFVKMINRKDAESARHGMEEYREGSTQLRTKWGVGFGPRDCSDYQTGISVIPIYRLTDADRKWMLTAEYGGTGGKPIQEGMVVEEPDIEIGAGVSSKAMSKRIPTDSGGRRGPQSSSSNRDREDRERRRNDRYRDDDRDRRDNDRPSSSTATNNPNMMPFPMGMNMNMGMNFPTMPSGMPMLPPGFPFPFPQGNMSQGQGPDGENKS